MPSYVDVEVFVTDWLKATLNYTNVVHEVPTNLVDLVRTAPVIVVERIGGNDSTITFDLARIDVDVYANSRPGAKEHAETIRQAMRTQLVRYMRDGTTVSRVDTIQAPIHAPYDSRNAVRRFVASYQLKLHQLSGV